MGGKPNKGTPADKHLGSNKPKGGGRRTSSSSPKPRPGPKK